MTIPHFANNHIYTPNGTVVIECGSNKWNITEAQSRGIDIGSKVAKLPEDDEIMTLSISLKLFNLFLLFILINTKIVLIIIIITLRQC